MLAALAARGLVGYDLSTGAYFHRELPFDLSLVDQLQPRLVAAKKLLAAGGVKPLTPTLTAPARDAGRYRRIPRRQRRGASRSHLCRRQPLHVPVVLEISRPCGPCKHVLAVQIFADQESPPA